jgi:hypothetical protein
VRELDSSESMMESSLSEFKVYPRRWLILAIFCSLELCNNLLCFAFAPISDIAGNFFGGGYYGSNTSINMLANIILVMYIPGTCVSILLMKYFRMKRSLAICGLLTVLAALLRFIAAYNINSLGFANAYAIMMLGQALAGLGQPMFLNSPPAIAAIWFPVDEREMATTIGSMFSPIGSALGQIVPVLIVSQSSKNSTFVLLNMVEIAFA